MFFFNEQIQFQNYYSIHMSLFKTVIDIGLVYVIDAFARILLQNEFCMCSVIIYLNI